MAVHAPVLNMLSDLFFLWFFWVFLLRIGWGVEERKSFQTEWFKCSDWIANWFLMIWCLNLKMPWSHRCDSQQKHLLKYLLISEGASLLSKAILCLSSITKQCTSRWSSSSCCCNLCTSSSLPSHSILPWWVRDSTVLKYGLCLWICFYR